MTTPPTDDLDKAVRVRRERRKHAGEHSLAQTLAMVGVLGWTIVLPALAGVAIGRWLDRALHTGIAVTAALVFLGVAVGCALAWRRMRG
jgi:ATP synthase protein I